MQGDTSIVAEETKRVQKKTQQQAKKDHKDIMRDEGIEEKLKKFDPVVADLLRTGKYWNGVQTSEHRALYRGRKKRGQKEIL